MYHLRHMMYAAQSKRAQKLGMVRSHVLILKNGIRVKMAHARPTPMSERAILDSATRILEWVKLGLVEVLKDGKAMSQADLQAFLAGSVVPKVEKDLPVHESESHTTEEIEPTEESDMQPDEAALVDSTLRDRYNSMTRAELDREEGPGFGRVQEEGRPDRRTRWIGRVT
jgi:hypothetical protein